jgi:hypothetical protein
MAVTTLADDAAELAEMAGLVLDAGQRQLLRDGMGKTADGRWAACEIRGAGQAVLLARELAGLFLLDERILHAAGDYSAAAGAFRRAAEAIESCEEMRHRVKRMTRAHGAEGIELYSGARARFAFWRSGRGYACDCLITEVAASLDEDARMQLLPCLAGRPDPQIWYGW